MNNIGSPPTKRMRLSGEELSKISKDEIIQLYVKQQGLLNELQAKSESSDKGLPKGSILLDHDHPIGHIGQRNPGDKSKATETSRRENVLVMRLATKEQELQQFAAQLAHIKKSQEDIAAKSLREALLDPAVNLLFDRMIDELKETKSKLEQAQSELSAWKFTPDSQTGKKLMSRCRTLIAENQELGKQLSQGKVAQLEAELALQKKYSEDLKQSQEELNEFVIQLDEEVEGMQSTIQLLQQQLNESRKDAEHYKKQAQTARDDKQRTKEDSGAHADDSVVDVAEKPERKTEVGANVKSVSPVGAGNNLDTNDNMDTDQTIEARGENLGREGESEVSTYSEHEIIDESQDSSPDMTPERDATQAAHSDTTPGPSGGEIDPMNDGEVYKVIDDGSDDDTVANDRTGATRKGSVASADLFGHDDSLDYEETMEEEEEEEEIQIVEENVEIDVPVRDDASAGAGDVNAEAAGNDNAPNASREEKIDSVRVKVESVGSDIENAPDADSDQKINSVPVKVESVVKATLIDTRATNQTEITMNGEPTEPSENAARPSEAPANLMSLPDSKPELQLPPINGPQAALSSLARSLMQPQVPLMADPAAYLVNPHFQHLPGAGAALAQQQAILAEQAMIYKTMLAQQQCRAAADDVPKSGDNGDVTKSVNPIVAGLQFPDPSAAFLAQYKAMLAAQSMFVPGHGGDAKSQQVLGGLGLYPGLPLVQPSVLTQPSDGERGTGNSVSAAWPSSTSVTFAHHPLMTQAFLGGDATRRMMMYPGLSAQSVMARPPAMDPDRHHGSGDHRPVSNGVSPAPKSQDQSDSNHVKEEPPSVA